jgi:hypothetical protein
MVVHVVAQAIALMLPTVATALGVVAVTVPTLGVPSLAVPPMRSPATTA